MQVIKISPQQFSQALFQLEGISKETIAQHLKLYQGYVNKYNEINKQLAVLSEESYLEANQVYSHIRELKVELSFAFAGVVNHELYFSHLGRKEELTDQSLRAEIERSFGSLTAYFKDLKATAISARGWAWTVWIKREKRLVNYLGDSQNTFLVWGGVPILALDTYEHAYFADFGVNRSAYIDVFFKNLNWSQIAKNFELAKK
jgi:Fe-Mn family superoxide dismutase